MKGEDIYIKAFNHGYNLRKDKPFLANQLIRGFAKKDHIYAQGFEAGAEEYQRAHRLEQLLSDEKERQTRKRLLRKKAQR